MEQDLSQMSLLIIYKIKQMVENGIGVYPKLWATAGEMAKESNPV